VQKLAGLHGIWSRLKGLYDGGINEQVDRLSQRLKQSTATKPELQQKLIAAQKLAQATTQLEKLPQDYSASDCVQMLRSAMAKAHGKKAIAVERLAKLQVIHAQLIKDYETATYRQSPVVAEAINCASDELHAASASLFRQDPEDALRLAGISWLHIKFGRQIFDAETIEHLLGESDYLELNDVQVPLDKLIERYFRELEAELSKFSQALKQSQAS